MPDTVTNFGAGAGKDEPGGAANGGKLSELEAAHEHSANLVFDDTKTRLIKALLQFNRNSATVPEDVEAEEALVLRITRQQLAQAVGAACEPVSLALAQLRQRDLPGETGKSKISLICDAETLRLDQGQRNRLSALLWDYITTNRDSTDRDVLVAVGSAIRKYVAMLNVERMGEISELLEAGHRAPLPLRLELEVVKMIYRKFEANPPRKAGGQQILAERLFDMAKVYATPRQILRDRYATVAALSIEAIVAMRAEQACEALELALTSGFTFFREMVVDDLQNMQVQWRAKCVEAADWCEELLNQHMPANR